MLREVLLRNFGWKMLSLGLAVAIWLTVRAAISQSGGQSVRTFNAIPAQIVSSTTDVRTFRVIPETVSITVRGRSEIITALTVPEIHAFVDVTSTDASQNFTRDVRVATPVGITLVRVDPGNVTVEVPPKPPAKFPGN